MKPVKTIAIGAIITLTLCFAALINRGSATKAYNFTTRGDGFAVLELFTSEGCSSCPPADELLARIQQETASLPVYVLAYHVDYWNRLGWRDVFSRPEFSKRQYQYNSWLGAQVYTPQLVINGKTAVVGSDEIAVTSAIKDALNGRVATLLSLSAMQQGHNIKVSYRVKDRVSTDQVLLAIVEKQAVSKVASGENGGRTLHHVQIVRNLYTVDKVSSGHDTRQIPVPEGFNTREWEIIGLLQDTQTGIIKGAAHVTMASISGS